MFNKAAIGEVPNVFKNPIRYLQYCAHTSPHLFFPACIALLGPFCVFVVTPIRRKYFYEDAPRLPLSGYPLPNKPRNPNLTGYDD